MHGGFRGLGVIIQANKSAPEEHSGAAFVTAPVFVYWTFPFPQQNTRVVKTQAAKCIHQVATLPIWCVQTHSPHIPDA